MPAHLQIDLHAGLRGAVERLDALLVDEGVHLHRDVAVAVRPWRAISRSMRSMMPARRLIGRDEQLAVVVLVASSRSGS